MKVLNLLSLSIVCILFLSCSSNEISEIEQNKSSNYLYFEDWPKIKEGGIKTVWTIGRKSRNCAGIGICKLKEASIYVKFESNFSESTGNNKINIENNIGAIISVFPSSPDRFSFLVNEENLEKINDYFGSSSLILEEDYIFTSEESSILEITEAFLIESGNYEFNYDESYNLYEIIFQHNN